MAKKWYKVLETTELKENRVTSVSCGRKTLCMTRFKGEYGAMENGCPHQGGPLGEGSIEDGWLRCPWHGWDFHPLTGLSPGTHEDGVPTFEVEEREDGVYVSMEEEDAHQTTVSDIMAETMVNWGIRQVFGMVGHSNLGLADAIRRQCDKGNMHYYGVRHEGSAAFACSGYAKLTGRPAACLAIAGPGSTNLLTGLWDAHVDRAPVLALSGQVETQFLGPGAFQEIDLQDAFGKVAQFSQLVLPDSKHSELINLACKSALLNRTVSHLIFPDQVQTHPAADDAKVGGPDGRLGNLNILPAEDSLKQAVAQLKKSERPVIICGHGARFEMDKIMALAEKLNLPVLTTFKGKGVIADSHPLACGVLGRSGTPIASWFMNECDTILVFGASFSNHTGISDKKKLIQVDYDLMNLGKFHSVDVPIWGEIGVTASLLAKELNKSKDKKVDRAAEIAERWKLWRAEKNKRIKDDKGQGINSCVVFSELSKHSPKDAIIAVDVGNNTYSFGRYFESKDNQAVLMSGYLGSIGFALPAAMGAWTATQEDDPKFAKRKVISVSGDGGLGQYLADVTTAAKYKMNITHILLHNKELGKISKEQRVGGFDVWETSLNNPVFSDFVNSCGGLGIKVTKVKDLAPAIARAMKHKGFAMVEIITDAALI
ncbi:MAG: Rieske 2Fe-2S domain-containing protein [Gammaproteobacteria bacterium]|nr:Rieske 2Fe-2S domain-containing protein [Gammaproteobacteria bacterium]